MSDRAPLGIFGGTFDPVHFGHLRLAEEAADALGLARVRWIPAGSPALRGAPRVAARQRLEMVRLATAGNPRFELDSAEVEAAAPSYTVPTLERLRADAGIGNTRPLVLLVGADAFAGMIGWHRWEALFELAHVGVAYRPGYPIDADALPSALAALFRARSCADAAELKTAPGGRIATFAMTQLDISATKIRTLLSKRRSTRYLLPDALIAYIGQHHLYSEN
ncbi:MAG: nicotinate-nucleotide adenylyltransferase [Propionivibrio sp.]